jgi:hypothetical protein
MMIYSNLISNFQAKAANLTKGSVFEAKNNPSVYNESRFRRDALLGNYTMHTSSWSKTQDECYAMFLFFNGRLGAMRRRSHSGHVGHRGELRPGRGADAARHAW